MSYAKHTYSLPVHLRDWLKTKAESLDMAISTTLARELEKSYQAEIAKSRRAEGRGK